MKVVISLLLPFLSLGLSSCFLALSSLLHSFDVFQCFFFLRGILASPALSVSCLFHFCLPCFCSYVCAYLLPTYFFKLCHVPERVQHDRLALTKEIVVLNSPRLPNNAAVCIQMNARSASEKMDNRGEHL